MAGEGGVEVSIPLWFDSNSSSGRSGSNNLKVSIPLWFDSNPLAARVLPRPVIMFPFHYGSILT